MKRRLSVLALVCVLILVPLNAMASVYDDIDPSVVNGAEELSWATIVGVNDTPFDDGATTADVVFVDNTGTKLEMPEDQSQWSGWMADVCDNQTGGKGDLAFAKLADEDFLRCCYDPDDTTYTDYKRHIYSDGTRLIICGLKGYVYWSTGTDNIQHGAKIVYDEETGTYTISEFNLLTMDGSYDDVLAAAFFRYLRSTCNYRVETQTSNLLLRAEPDSNAEVLAKIAKGNEIALLFDYVYLADNGYDYMPVRYDAEEKTYYGWVAREYLGMNDRVDAVTWVGPRPTELGYPSAEDIVVREGKDAITLTVTVGNTPKKGDAFKEGETVVFVIEAANNTFEDIDDVVLAGAEDTALSIPWRQARRAEISHKVTAEEAAAGTLTASFTVAWTDADGAPQTASSASLSVPTVAK